MEKMYAERVTFKKRMLAAKQLNETKPSKALEKEISRCNNIQMAKKISLNSAYGAIGNQYFRYFKLEKCRGYYLYLVRHLFAGLRIRLNALYE